MDIDIPAPFITLQSAALLPPSKLFNTIGIVTDVLPKSKTRGTDWTCKFTIADSTFGLMGERGNDGLTVRFFKPEIDLPPIQGQGDIVVLYDVKASVHNGNKLALSFFSTSWAVISLDVIPSDHDASKTVQLEHKKSHSAPKLLPAHVQYILRLAATIDRTQCVRSPPESEPHGGQQANGIMPGLEQIPVPVLGSKPRRSTALIKDIESSQFYDIFAQVVRIYSHSDRTELSITDYTSNSNLWDHKRESEQSAPEGDQFGYIRQDSAKKNWTGPWGKQALTVILWEPHSSFCQESVKVNDFVLLKNVRIKDNEAKLEGVIHSDRWRPDQVNISMIKDFEDHDSIKAILRRKKEYWKTVERSAPGPGETHGPKRAQSENDKPLSKNQLKKKRKLERQQAQANKNGNSEIPLVSTTEAPPKPIKSSTKNPDIRCANQDIPIRSLSSIKSLEHHQNKSPAGIEYTLPFLNIKSRAQVRVVDFRPYDLADFAVRLPKPKEYDVLSDISSSTDSSQSLNDESDDGISPPPSTSDSMSNKRKWEWRFALTLEDASKTIPPKQTPEKIEVFVVGQDAEYLLKLDAQNLRKDGNTLAALREKLFLLWGDLQERKEKNAHDDDDDDDDDGKMDGNEVKNRPFECCLMEYGVKQPSSVIELPSLRDCGVDEQTKMYNSWRRRWRMCGCTII